MIRTYTDEQVINAVKNNTTLAGVLRELNLVVAGGNYHSIKRIISELNLDTSHFNRSWNKGKQLKHKSHYKGIEQIKRWTIKERGHKCEDCKLSLWKEEPIPLELHHVDGDRTNNSDDNLLLLCPNCHTFTENWRRSKTTNDVTILRAPSYVIETKTKVKKKEQVTLCCDCNTEINRKATRCKPCAGRHREPTKIDWPNMETLAKMVEDSSYLAVARELGVSDNAVRKRLKKHGKRL